jgi:uncharacterized protein (TIGR02001 family)
MPTEYSLLARPTAGVLRTAFFAAAACVLPALPAAAQAAEESYPFTVTLTPVVSTDYLFRGISQTRNNWAVQGALDIEHGSGIYIGAFASTAKFLADPYNNTRQELDLMAGYRFELAGINLDLGYIAYLYPGQDKAPGGQLNEYHEVAIKASYAIEPVTVMAAFNYSPNFFGRSGNGYYIEGGADVALPYEFTAAGRLGYQWIERNAAFGTPDYLWYSISISRELFAGIDAAVGWYGTNIDKQDCLPVADRADRGQRACDGRVLFTLSRSF